MDFRSLCQKLDVDSIRAKLPAMPPMPTLPQIKLPKALPKLKSRKIFGSSRDPAHADVGGSVKNSPKSQQQPQAGAARAAPPPPPSIPPHAEFIKHTPTRISTISSLMYEHGADSDVRRGAVGGGTYYSANSIDDDYPMPRRASRPISPVRMPLSSGNTPEPGVDGIAGTSNVRTLSFTEKLQKGYKDITEFRLKHIFAKKTVVRRDTIEVDRYVLQYDEERRREQIEEEQREREIANNYRINFTLSNTRQNTIDSQDDSLHGTPRAHLPPTRSSVGEHSGDESGMEVTPPARKPGIAATRFARVRSPPLSMPTLDQPPDDATTTAASDVAAKRKAGYKQRFKSYMSSHEQTATDGENEPPTSTEPKRNVTSNILARLPSLGKAKSEDTLTGKRKAPQSPEQSTPASGEKPTLQAIKANLKRLQKSMKRPGQLSTASGSATDKAGTGAATDESDDEGELGARPVPSPPTVSKPPTRRERIAAQLRRFKSTEQVQTSVDGTECPTDPVAGNTNGGGLSGKLQNWKQSLKRSTTNTAAERDIDSSPEKSDTRQQSKRSSALLKKLKYIRSRKAPSTSHEDGLDQDSADEAATAATKEQASAKSAGSRKMGANIEHKFTQARERTMRKVNEKMQQMKFFHKSQENMGAGERSREEQPYTGRQAVSEQTTPEHRQACRTHDEPTDYYANNNSSSDDEEDLPARGAPTAIGAKQQQQQHQSHRLSHASDTDTNYSREIAEVNTLQAEHAQSSGNITGGAGTLTAWTTKPILCEDDSMDSDSDADASDNRYPRVLIHQDDTDAFESTLIITMTRPASASPTTRISEPREPLPLAASPPPKRALTPPAAIPTGWVPNKQIITSFLQISPPMARRAKRASSNSASTIVPGNDAWLSVEAATQMVVDDAAWQVLDTKQPPIYKTKSIDIFEVNTRKGGASAAFEDFDAELHNAPIVKIGANVANLDSFERESSEDPDAADDDNSSRVTKICLEAINEVPITTTTKRQFGNSCESLIVHSGGGSGGGGFGEHETSDYDLDEDEQDEENMNLVRAERPPSAAASPPPKYSPPPPPLPVRRQPPTQQVNKQPLTLPPPPPPLSTHPEQPSRAVDNNDSNDEIAEDNDDDVDDDDLPPPPLPASKPPLAALPKIPERTASMSQRPGKPLVKTSSLRLAYNEQVNPGDVGKVNKLISRFEPPGSIHRERRPRIVARRMLSQESEEYSDDDDEEQQQMEQQQQQAKAIATTTTTASKMTAPPPARQQQIAKIPEIITTRDAAPLSNSINNNDGDQQQTVCRSANNNNNNTKFSDIQRYPSDSISRSTLSLDRKNSNCSRSEYGSPLAYPASLCGSNETTPTPARKQLQEKQQQQLQQIELQRQHARRSRRSMTRDDDNFYSFDSDEEEENSYYSISPSNSSRYVVDI